MINRKAKGVEFTRGVVVVVVVVSCVVCGLSSFESVGFVDNGFRIIRPEIYPEICETALSQRCDALSWPSPANKFGQEDVQISALFFLIEPREPNGT
jgi:hypothetical protein